MGQQLILDRYRPLDELGQGAFGAVVLAWDTRMQRRVAIKRLPLPADMVEKSLRPAGLAEARTSAMLTHHNIVTALDFDTDSDEAFLIMEYVDGASLADVLESVESLDADEAAAVLSDVSAALRFAHENGVLHLDIKPENVLITRDGTVKVADFGMAELSSISGHDAAGGGTLGYMPLEQLDGSTPTERTDEWALAAMMFELLTGVNPYLASTRQEAIVNVRVLAPPIASEYTDSDLDADIDDVLLVALSVRPDDRFEDVSAFAEELGSLLGDPAEGRESLADIIATLTDEDESAEEYFAPIGLWDRAGGRAGMVLVRLVAALESAWLAWAGLAPLQLDTAAQAGAAAFVALAGLLAPGLGIALGLGCFVVGVGSTGALFTAGILGVLGATWWWLFARHSPGAAVLPLAGPPLGALRLGLAQPLIAGFSLPPLRAAAAALLGGVLTMLASAASSNPPPYLNVLPGYALDVWGADLALANIRTLVTSPASYIALLAWPAAAVAMSIASSSATRSGAFIGTLGGSALLGGAYLLAERVAAATGTMPGYESADLAFVLVASSILVALVAALGAPLRAEEEHALAMGPEEYEDDES